MTLWTVACQTPLSVEFFRQEYWSGLPLPTPGGLPNPRIEPVSLASPALAGRFFITAPHGKPCISMNKNQNSQIFPWNLHFTGKETETQRD